ncbi:MAG: carbohydrate binding family 9 domain-containing protein, partial [Gemmatimonadaceae bacterium]
MLSLGAQTVVLGASQSPATPSARAAANASRAAQPPSIDGRDDDAAWRDATPITEFRQFDPVEDAEPSMPTEARVTYDDAHLYLFVRAYDPRPDSIIALLSRRDVRTASDQIKVMIDSYHDRRTGFEFAVNPAGVKRDYYAYDDGAEDVSWDAVWDVATRIDSLGWTAEFRIPLSQLRYPPAASHTFGVMIIRELARRNERVSWPLLRRSRNGLVSQF